MNRLLSAALLLTLGASLLEAASLEDFRNSFNVLGSDIDEEVQVLRAENSDAILAMNHQMLRLLANYSVDARSAFFSKNLSIQIDDWLNENPDHQPCFEWAYVMLDFFAVVISLDIGSCANYAAREVSADAQYHFYSHAHYIMRAGTHGRLRVLESFGLPTGEDEKLEFLQQEFDWLEYLWGNYQKVLKEEIEGHADTAEWIAEELDECLKETMEHVAYYIDYVDNDLQQCLESV